MYKNREMVGIKSGGCGKYGDLQERFCREYVIDLNATQAAIRAGYSPKSAQKMGSKLYAHEDIRRRIEELKADRNTRLNISADYVLDVITDTIERCRQGKQVRDRNGKPVTVECEDGERYAVYRYDAKSVLKGAELLGRHLGLFIDKHEVTGRDGKDLIPPSQEIDLSKLSDSALAELRRVAGDDNEDEGQ